MYHNTPSKYTDYHSVNMAYPGQQPAQREEWRQGKTSWLQKTSLKTMKRSVVYTKLRMFSAAVNVSLSDLL